MRNDHEPLPGDQSREAGGATGSPKEASGKKFGPPMLSIAVKRPSIDPRLWLLPPAVPARTLRMASGRPVRVVRVLIEFGMGDIGVG